MPNSCKEFRSFSSKLTFGNQHSLKCLFYVSRSILEAEQVAAGQVEWSYCHLHTLSHVDAIYNCTIWFVSSIEYLNYQVRYSDTFFITVKPLILVTLKFWRLSQFNYFGPCNFSVFAYSNFRELARLAKKTGFTVLLLNLNVMTTL